MDLAWTAGSRPLESSCCPRARPAGAFAYSSLTVLDDGSIGLLYERDEYKSIAFTRFNLAGLLDRQ